MIDYYLLFVTLNLIIDYYLLFITLNLICIFFSYHLKIPDLHFPIAQAPQNILPLLHDNCSLILRFFVDNDR